MPDTQPTHSGVVPYLTRGGALHTVLITNSQGKWGFPKGFIDPGDTGPEAAETEAFEEAGLIGAIHETPFAAYTRAKWGKVFLVEMYLFQVTDILESWDEEGFRKRKVVPLDEARARVRKELRDVLARATELLGGM